MSVMYRIASPYLVIRLWMSVCAHITYTFTHTHSLIHSLFLHGFTAVCHPFFLLSTENRRILIVYAMFILVWACSRLPFHRAKPTIKNSLRIEENLEMKRIKRRHKSVKTRTSSYNIFIYKHILKKKWSNHLLASVHAYAATAAAAATATAVEMNEGTEEKWKWKCQSKK